MANATINKSGDDYTVSGGSSSDPITIKDIQAATNSDLEVLNRNAVVTTSKKEYKYQFDSNSFVDLTGARIFLKNNANNQNVHFEFNGGIRVGSADEKQKQCEIHFGDKDSGEYTNASFPLLGTDNTAVVDCPNVDNRIKLMCHLDGPTARDPDNPNMYNGCWIENNVSGNKIRVSILGASYTYGSSYVLPDANGFKPNGTIQTAWAVGSNVEVRDIEFRDGFVDWRPKGNWATPTRGVFVSETWMKFLGEGVFSFTAPLIFGNQDDPFQVVVGNSGQTGSYLLHGIWSNGTEGRLVYNNFMGLTWATQIAMYRRGDKIRMENHLQLDYKLIDSLAQPIQDAVITLYKKDPVYNSTGNDVAYSGAENDFDTTTDADGIGNIGNGDGDNANNICVEAFCGYDNGGNVDGAYANKDHSNADYDSNSDVYYTIIKWGKKPIIRTQYTCKLSGEVGEGKQSLGVIQLETDLSLTSATIDDVPTTITNAESFYDNAYKYAVDNKIALFCTKEGDTIITTKDIVFDNNAVDLLSYDGTTITIKTDTWGSSIKAPKVTIATAMDLTDLKLDTELHFIGTTDVNVSYSQVTVVNDVLNDMANNKVTINLLNNSSATTSEPGTGNGEVNLVNSVIFKFTVAPSITNYEWRIYEVTSAGSLNGSVEVAGEEVATVDNQEYMYNYVSDKTIAVQILSQPTNDFIESISYYTISNVGQDVMIQLIKDNNN